MKAASLNIMIIIPHLLCGGTERSASELANYIAKEGGNVSLLLMYKKDKFYKIHPAVKVIEPKYIPGKYGKYLYIFFLIFFIRRQIKKQNPDLILALGYILYTLLSSFFLNTKVIVSFRTSPSRIRFPERRTLNGLYKISHRILKSRVNGIIAQTRFASDVYRKLYSCKVEIIPNFIREIKDYYYVRKNQIITVGRCSPEKGQKLLINAFSKIESSEWDLIIVGDGPERTKLEHMTEELGLSSRIIFTGFQEDIDYFLSQSKIFALPSLIEGFPNSLIEAMANHLAPVSFNCNAGPGEIIQHGQNGFLVDVGKTEVFTSYLNQLISDESLLNKISDEASKVRQTYSLELIGQRYLDFFFLILNENSPN